MLLFKIHGPILVYVNYIYTNSLVIITINNTTTDHFISLSPNYLLGSSILVFSSLETFLLGPLKFCFSFFFFVKVFFFFLFHIYLMFLVHSYIQHFQNSNNHHSLSLRVDYYIIFQNSIFLAQNSLFQLEVLLLTCNSSFGQSFLAICRVILHCSFKDIVKRGVSSEFLDR